MAPVMIDEAPSGLAILECREIVLEFGEHVIRRSADRQFDHSKNDGPRYMFRQDLPENVLSGVDLILGKQLRAQRGGPSCLDLG